MPAQPSAYQHESEQTSNNLRFVYMITQAGEKSKANTKKICVVQQFDSVDDACYAYGEPVQGQGLQCSGCSQDGLYQEIGSRSAAAVQIKSEGGAFFIFYF